jgi:hypothetical protein
MVWSIAGILLILAAICFLLATINVASKVNLVALGLLFLTAAQFFYGK